jgi:hypothetical protein
MERSIMNMEEERKSSEEWETIVVELMIESGGCIEKTKEKPYAPTVACLSHQPLKS